MKISLVKRLATTALALGLAGGAFGLSTATAFASPPAHEIHATAVKQAKTAKKTAPAKKVASPKAGKPCTKAELGKTAKSGKTTLACEKSGKSFKWVAKKAVKPVAKKTAKKTAKPVAKKTAKK
ncbi:MAG: hypothetical protein M0005_18200 [Actinomycetota bacterium]|jgi:hypothetical protein|nr:hypothetical protein [Actinomycetota bacterium]